MRPEHFRGLPQSLESLTHRSQQEAGQPVPALTKMAKIRHFMLGLPLGVPLGLRFPNSEIVYAFELLTL